MLGVCELKSGLQVGEAKAFFCNQSDVNNCCHNNELASVGKRIELVIRTRPMLPDPNDEMVLETAINGRADAIVTFNDRDFRPVATRFRCSVLRPGEVVRRLAEEAK
jgi:predicted nucleic acid-binding protein